VRGIDARRDLEHGERRLRRRLQSGRDRQPRRLRAVPQSRYAGGRGFTPCRDRGDGIGRRRLAVHRHRRLAARRRSGRAPGDVRAFSERGAHLQSGHRAGAARAEALPRLPDDGVGPRGDAPGGLRVGRVPDDPPPAVRRSPRLRRALRAVSRRCRSRAARTASRLGRDVPRGAGGVPRKRLAYRAGAAAPVGARLAQPVGLRTRASRRGRGFGDGGDGVRPRAAGPRRAGGGAPITAGTGGQCPRLSTAVAVRLSGCARRAVTARRCYNGAFPGRTIVPDNESTTGNTP
jgi:hypothetical protein